MSVIYKQFAQHQHRDQAAIHFKNTVNMETQISMNTFRLPFFIVVFSDAIKSSSTDTLVQDHPACDRAASFVGAERFDVLAGVSATLAETVTSTAYTALKPARADQDAKERRTSAPLTQVSASAAGRSPFH